MAATSVPKLYRSVIEDVINGVKDVFLDEGVDEQALQELRQIWEKKLMESKAVDTHEPPPPQPSFQRTAHTVVQQQQQHQAAAASNPVAAQAIAHQLTIGPNGIVQPTVLQYHSTATPGGKLTITLPAQSAQQGLQTVMYRPQHTHASSATTAALALHPDVAASLLQGGVLNMAHATALQTAARNAGAQQATVSNVQFQHLMKPTGEPGQYTVTMGQAIGGQAGHMIVTNAQPVNQANAPVTVANQMRNATGNQVIQLDGPNDTSDEEEEEDDFQDNDDDKDDNDDDLAEEDNDDAGEEEEPLNSDDDVSDEEVSENFEIDNVVVCQYDKISRSRNRWKFHLKDGIMNLQGKDYVFQKAVGDAEW